MILIASECPIMAGLMTFCVHSGLKSHLSLSQQSGTLQVNRFYLFMMVTVPTQLTKCESLLRRTTLSCFAYLPIQRIAHNPWMLESLGHFNRDGRNAVTKY